MSIFGTETLSFSYSFTCRCVSHWSSLSRKRKNSIDICCEQSCDYSQVTLSLSFNDSVLSQPRLIDPLQSKTVPDYYTHLHLS